MNPSYARFATINVIGLLLCGLLFTWIARDGALDFRLAHLFFDPSTHSFPLRVSDALDFWGHTVLKLFTVWILVIAAVVLVVSNWVESLKSWRRALFLFVVMAACAAYLVQTLKGASVHSCPWDINTFGGSAQWFPLFGPIGAMSGPGLCWPGGHASGGFAVMAGYFALRDSKPKLARLILIFSLAIGALMSVVQMARGAHFLSHNLWSMWLVWVTCFVIDALMRLILPPPRVAV
jgi:membrane-associated PAP2 superfamily phosphatase